MKQKLKRFMAGFMAMLTLVGTLFLRMEQQHLQPVRRQILRSGMRQSKIPEK